MAAMAWRMEGSARLTGRALPRKDEPATNSEMESHVGRRTPTLGVPVGSRLSGQVHTENMQAWLYRISPVDSIFRRTDCLELGE